MQKVMQTLASSLLTHILPEFLALKTRVKTFVQLYGSEVTVGSHKTALTQVLKHESEENCISQMFCSKFRIHSFLRRIIPSVMRRVNNRNVRLEEQVCRVRSGLSLIAVFQMSYRTPSERNRECIRMA